MPDVESLDHRRRVEGVGPDARGGTDGVLGEPVREDHVATEQLPLLADGSNEELPVVDYELEVEGAQVGAGLAGAGGAPRAISSSALRKATYVDSTISTKVWPPTATSIP